MENNREYSEITEILLQQVLEVFETTHYSTTDSRKIRNGCIFVSLRGENFNGNVFAKNAIENGAAIVIIDDTDYYIDKRTILVKDSLVFLQKFANRYRRKFSIPFIAISGTNGKTTTKELMHAVLSKKYKVHATEGNLNNQIGVPLTLLSMQENTQIAIIEMGASHIGDLDELCEIAEPTMALLTNIGTAHIEGFGSKEGVVKTKTELYRYVANKHGRIFANIDDENLQKYAPKEAITYSLYKQADIKANKIHEDTPFASICVNDTEINSHLVGSYNCYNILAALSVGLFFKISLEDIKQAIEEYNPQNNRPEIKHTNKNTLILDCYNANPSSCCFALNAFDRMQAKNKIVMLGSMKELGSVSEQEHANIVQIVKDMHTKQAIFVGQEYKKHALGKDIYWFSTSLEAKEFVEKENIQDSLILIKGSRATKMEILIDAL